MAKINIAGQSINQPKDMGEVYNLVEIFAEADPNPETIVIDFAAAAFWSEGVESDNQVMRTELGELNLREWKDATNHLAGENIWQGYLDFVERVKERLEENEKITQITASIDGFSEKREKPKYGKKSKAFREKEILPLKNKLKEIKDLIKKSKFELYKIARKIDSLENQIQKTKDKKPKTQRGKDSKKQKLKELRAERRKLVNKEYRITQRKRNKKLYAFEFESIKKELDKKKIQYQTITKQLTVTKILFSVFVYSQEK